MQDLCFCKWHVVQYIQGTLRCLALFIDARTVAQKVIDGIFKLALGAHG